MIFHTLTDIMAVLGLFIGMIWVGYVTLVMLFDWLDYRKWKRSRKENIC